MKKIIAILLIAFASIASSFTPEKTISVKLTIPQAEIVLRALSKLPYEESAALITEIQMQAQKQLTDSTTRK